MNANAETTVYDLPIDRIQVFISRRRNKEKLAAQKESMAKIGLKQPIEVRDLRQLPKDQRKRPDGGYYDFLLIKGQGRIEAATELGWKTIPGFMVQADDLEAAGRFMAENTNRVDLTAFERGELIARRLEDGAEIEQVAEVLSISLQLAKRYLAAFRGTATEVQNEARKLPMNTLEILTSLPAEGQTIVMEIARETAIPVVEIATRAKKARAAGTKLTKTGLKTELTEVDRQLAAIKKRLVVARLHDSIGPALIEQLWARPEFYDACVEEGINLDMSE